MGEQPPAVQLFPLFRGIAGDYATGQGIQYFTNDLKLAIDYAMAEAKKSQNVQRGAKPSIVQINVPPQMISAYRSKSTGQHSEVYDMLAQIVDRFPKKIHDMSIAQSMLLRQKETQDIGNSGQKMKPVMFKGQGPSPQGWTMTFLNMGVPQPQKTIVKSVRDAAPGLITYNALQMRMQAKGEVPALVITADGMFITTMLPQALQVMKAQAGKQMVANTGQFPPVASNQQQ